MIVNLSKNQNFSISSNANGGVVVNTFNGGKLVTQAINGEQTAKQVLTVADEVLPLYDGKILKRINDALYVE